jgi:hypothetical protein
MESSRKKKVDDQEPISEEERARLLKIQQKKDAKKVYKPLIRTLKNVIDDLGKLERDIPIYKIARMDIDGVFSKKRHAKMRRSVLEFLKKANTYRKTIWNFQKNCKKLFDEEMLKNGSSAPGLSEYESLRNQLPKSILDENGKVWSMSFDTYLPKIIEHSPKSKSKPINGAQMFMLINKKSKKIVNKIKKLQVQNVVAGQELVEDLKIAMKSPDKEWLEWHEDVKKRARK